MEHKSLSEVLSFGLNDHSKKVFGTLNLDTFKLVERINTICGRYHDILYLEYAEFTVAEWCALCDVTNGAVITSLAELYTDILDADDAGDLNIKWEIDARALASRLLDLSAAQSFATLEVVSRFWKINTDCKWASHQAHLEAAGAVIIPDRPDAEPLTPMSFGL
jgi:hypothetical protein